VLSIMLADSRALKPFERLYERIGSRDASAAIEILARKSESDGPLPALDSVAIPALRLLERDRLAGLLDPDELATAREVFAQIAEEALENGHEVDPAGLPVLCVPAAGGVDEIIAEVLAHELGRRGIAARARPRGLTSELVDEVRDGTAPLVCVSALDPSSSALRHLLKRLQRARPAAFIAVGCWGEPKERLVALRAELSRDLEIEFVASLGEASDLLAARSRLVDAPGNSTAAALHAQPSAAG
jgi:hypothetical protein